MELSLRTGVACQGQAAGQGIAEQFIGSAQLSIAGLASF